MSNIPGEHGLNLAAPYRPMVSTSQPSFMSFPTPHSPDMSPQAAMAAALVAAQTSAVAVEMPSQPDFSRAPVTSMDPASDTLSMRLPNLDLSLHRQQRSIIPSYPMSVSMPIPIPSQLPPVQPVASVGPNTSSHITALPSSYSHPLPISHLTSDHMPYCSKPASIPPMTYSASVSTAPLTKSDQGIIPAAAQQIDTTTSRGRGRAITGAVRKKATTARRKKSRTGPANFVCALVGCGKAFRMHGDLQTHMRKHTGVEPFACSFPDCGMRYKWRSSLSHHEGLHRKAKDFRLKPRRRRRSTATMLAMPGEQLMHVQNGNFTDAQASLVSAAGQTSLVNPAAQAGLSTSSTPTTLVSAAGQPSLISATSLGRLS